MCQRPSCEPMRPPCNPRPAPSSCRYRWTTGTRLRSAPPKYALSQPVSRRIRPGSPLSPRPSTHPRIRLWCSARRWPTDRGGHRRWHWPSSLIRRCAAAPASEQAPFPETHSLYFGGLPFAKGPLAERLAGHGLVVVGAPVFRYYGSYLPDGAKLWQITDDRGEAARAPVGDSVLADAVLAIGELTKLVAQRQRKRPLAAAPEHRMAPHPPSARPVGETLSTRAIFDKPADTVLVEDLLPTYRICTPPGLLSTGPLLHLR